MYILGRYDTNGTLCMPYNYLHDWVQIKCESGVHRDACKVKMSCCCPASVVRCKRVIARLSRRSARNT